MSLLWKAAYFLITFSIIGIDIGLGVTYIQHSKENASLKYPLRRWAELYCINLGLILIDIVLIYPLYLSPSSDLDHEPSIKMILLKRISNVISFFITTIGLILFMLGCYIYHRIGPDGKYTIQDVTYTYDHNLWIWFQVNFWSSVLALPLL